MELSKNTDRTRLECQEERYFLGKGYEVRRGMELGG